jgi:hypothetical protein
MIGGKQLERNIPGEIKYERAEGASPERKDIREEVVALDRPSKIKKTVH